MTQDHDKSEERLAMLDQMIAQGTNDPFVRYARALELRSLGRLEEALTAFDEVAERHPEYVPTYLMAGQVAEQLGAVDRARAWLERGIEKATAAGDAHARAELEQALEAL